MTSFESLSLIIGEQSSLINDLRHGLNSELIRIQRQLRIISLTDQYYCSTPLDKLFRNSVNPDSIRAHRRELIISGATRASLNSIWRLPRRLINQIQVLNNNVPHQFLTFVLTSDKCTPRIRYQSSLPQSNPVWSSSEASTTSCTARSYVRNSELQTNVRTVISCLTVSSSLSSNNRYKLRHSMINGALSKTNSLSSNTSPGSRNTLPSIWQTNLEDEKNVFYISKTKQCSTGLAFTICFFRLPTAAALRFS